MKGKAKGKSVLILNTNKSKSEINIPTDAKQYLLTAEELLTKKVRLNGEELSMTANDELPAIIGKKVKKGSIELPAQSIMFLTFNK